MVARGAPALKCRVLTRFDPASALAVLGRDVGDGLGLVNEENLPA
jgi:hypothetical protein